MTGPALAVGRHRHPRPRSNARRRLPVLLDLLLAVVICLVGFRYGTEFLQVHEARWVVAVLRLAGIDSLSDALPRHILVFRPDGAVILAEVTRSCSSILSVLGLTALTAVVLRSRRQHAVAGLVVAVGALLLLNNIRLAASTVAGLLWGDAALILFHDWVGTLWNLGSTLGGFLLMVCITLPAAERAEQDVAGRHTARRPDSWARPGLGYRLPEAEPGVRRRRLTLTALLHRFVLPRRTSAWLSARREAARIDYRIGHLPAAARADRVRALAADGLGAHAASLVAVATYDEDPDVLDVLADAIAARQWEPVTGSRVASLRLWARGWTLARARAGADHPTEPVPTTADPEPPAATTLPLGYLRPRPLSPLRSRT